MIPSVRAERNPLRTFVGEPFHPVLREGDVGTGPEVEVTVAGSLARLCATATTDPSASNRWAKTLGVSVSRITERSQRAAGRADPQFESTRDDNGDLCVAAQRPV